MAGEGARRMAQLLRSPEQLPIPRPFYYPPEATVVAHATPTVAEGPHDMGRYHGTDQDPLAQAGNPTPVAGPTICRQRYAGRNPREEPDALAGLSGSGAPGELAEGRGCKSPGTKE